jgi:hypothetical protein
MRLLGQLLIWGSLAVGAMSAATAYLVSLDLPDEHLVGLTLAAPPESSRETDRPAVPIADKNEQITPELLTRLRESGKRHIRVKEFRCRRWRGRWWFGLSMLGLIVGAMLTRWGTRPEQAAATTGHAPDDAQHVLDSIIREVQQLRAQLSSMPSRDAQLESIVQRVGQLQKTHLVALVDAREALVARLGLAGYAVLMDHFAAAERQLNRAWSAAVDGVLEEAVACVDEGATLLEQAWESLEPAPIRKSSAD